MKHMLRPLNRWHFLALWSLGFAVLLKLDNGLMGAIGSMLCMTAAVVFCFIAMGTTPDSE